jgi:hypothetical protein
VAAADAVLKGLVLGNRAIEGDGVIMGAPPFRIVLDVGLMEGVVGEERGVGSDR